MSQLLRGSFVVALAFLVAVTTTGCSNAATEAGAVATSGSGPATIGIETSSMFVTVVNNAGAPLQDIQVAITPVGSGLKFTSSISRMENGEKRDISLASFRGNDGTTFSPRLYKPKQVSVVAKDVVGKTHQRSLPWQ